jgi:DNA-nicking Smr family endonuclease
VEKRHKQSQREASL